MEFYLLALQWLTNSVTLNPASGGRGFLEPPVVHFYALRVNETKSTPMRSMRIPKIVFGKVSYRTKFGTKYIYVHSHELTHIVKAPEKSLFMVEMDTITGIEPAVGLPKPLVDMLNHLTRDNYLRSWQIYSENIGFTVKIRFGQSMFTVMPQSGEAVHATNTQPAENTQPTENTQAAVNIITMHYARKPPTKLRRDTHRANTYKRKRLNVESSPESTRCDL